MFFCASMKLFVSVVSAFFEIFTHMNVLLYWLNNKQTLTSIPFSVSTTGTDEAALNQSSVQMLQW